VETVPPSDEVREAILGGLAEFNAANGYDADLEHVALVVREGGEIAGGLWGKTVYGWLFVEYLIVPEHLRGRDLGSELMRAAEEMAQRRGCVGAWLTTFSFQARGFYERLGYSVFGELEDSPADNVRIVMRKRLDRA
jgi:GNAT superfamily N-acetyltransferase